MISSLKISLSIEHSQSVQLQSVLRVKSKVLVSAASWLCPGMPSNSCTGRLYSGLPSIGWYSLYKSSDVLTVETLKPKLELCPGLVLGGITDHLGEVEWFGNEPKAAVVSSTCIRTWYMYRHIKALRHAVIPSCAPVLGYFV